MWEGWILSSLNYTASPLDKFPLRWVRYNLNCKAQGPHVQNQFLSLKQSMHVIWPKEKLSDRVVSRWRRTLWETGRKGNLKEDRHYLFKFFDIWAKNLIAFHFFHPLFKQDLARINHCVWLQASKTKVCQSISNFWTKLKKHQFKIKMGG